MSREEEIVTSLMSNKLKYNSDLYADAISELLDILYGSGLYDSVVKLCNSDGLDSKRAGAWLASNLGKKAKLILDDVIGLIKHEDPVIRYEMVELILNCSERGRDILELLFCLNDKELAIRTRALDYLHFLSPCQISKGLICAKENGHNEIVEALHLFNRINDAKITIEVVCKNFEQYSMLEKKMAFVALFKIDTEKSLLSNIADRSNSDDLKNYYRHYISD